ncbi:GNAT family N-acetyltransferase [Pseudonocardia sp. ICBG162]|uniref:GNAT family N-acetyltransferase n=1 Tax=Pseudonocardia sp. ICBG162 TaxID=2846761 RepID=UPI001CF633E4|nr:GNAT family N-acetyltransferase [Pseudonocardia sp. ICBG162]
MGSRMHMRGFDPVCDAKAVLALINDDRVPGQPICTASMLQDAASGRSPVDNNWWVELDKPVIEVAENADGDLVGVASFALRRRDGVGFILWLHGREQPAVVELLINHSVRRLATRVVEAYQFATALGIGLEALPVAHRSATAAALQARGFAGTDMWRYMRRDLPAPELPTVDHIASSHVIAADESGEAGLAIVDDDGKIVGEVTVQRPQDGIAALWWINIEPAQRRRGLGRALLGSALRYLSDDGAEQVILFVDDDEPEGSRERASANRLYDQCGFEEIDRLHAFTLR